MKQVEIMEVGPRDGFQNVQTYIPLETKFKIVSGLVEAGIRQIQLTSFVSPKAIPQLRDSHELTALCLEKFPKVDFFALVPNLHGAKAAWEQGIKKVSYVISLSKSHNQANINRTHEASFAELERILEAYPGLQVGIDVATAFGCPFEGKGKDGPLLAFIRELRQKGLRSFNLCDTIGIADPAQVRRIIGQVLTEFADCQFQVHIHDTRNMGMVNTLAAIEGGITQVQSTLGGLGGCPFAPGASGNTATEDLVYMLQEMGVATGIDFQKLLSLAKYEKEVIKGVFSGHHIHIDAVAGSCL